MKQNITVAIDKQLLKRARAVAAQRQTSISAVLAAELKKMVAEDAEFKRVRTKAIALLSSPFALGGQKMASRDSLHDRHGLR